MGERTEKKRRGEFQLKIRIKFWSDVDFVVAIGQMCFFIVKVALKTDQKVIRKISNAGANFRNLASREVDKF